MAAFNVSDVDLTEWGYPDKVSFMDPMSSLFRAKTYTGTDLGQVRDVLLPYFQNLDAYPNPSFVENALDDYYKKLPSSSSSSTRSTSSVPSTLVTSTVASSSASVTPAALVQPSTTTPSSASVCISSSKGKNTCK